MVWWLPSVGFVGISACFGPEGPLGVLGVLWGQCFGSGGVPVLNPRISGRLISQPPYAYGAQGGMRIKGFFA